MLAVAYASGRQIKGDDPDKKGITWSSRLGVWRGDNNPTQQKKLLLRKANKGKSWMDLTMVERVGDR
jgi:hypothetical protein